MCQESRARCARVCGEADRRDIVLSDNEEDQFHVHNAPPSLSQLMKMYGSDDDLNLAIRNAEEETYKLMRQYNGVPAGVMFTTSITAIEWVTNLLAAMIVEVAGEVRGWDKEIVEVQEKLTSLSITLLRAHAVNVTLKAYAPKGGGNQDGT